MSTASSGRWQLQSPCRQRPAFWGHLVSGKYFKPSTGPSARICFLLRALPFPLLFPAAFWVSVCITMVFTTGSKSKASMSNSTHANVLWQSFLCRNLCGPFSVCPLQSYHASSATRIIKILYNICKSECDFISIVAFYS